MNNSGTFVALADRQGDYLDLIISFLLDAAITAVNVFILFIPACVSYSCINPVRDDA